jgi:hypothetical protein
MVGCLQVGNFEEETFMMFLRGGFSLIGIGLLIFANIRRISYIFMNLTSKPEIHKIFPKGFRNT